MPIEPTLDGIVLVTSRLGAQRRFYADVLGLPIRSEYPDAVFFGGDGARLVLFREAHHPEATRRLGGADHGVGHLEFGLSSAAVPGAQRRLADAGHHAYREVFHDADGNLLHFVADRRHVW